MANAPYYDEGLHVGEVRQQGISKAGTGNKQLVLVVKILGTPSDGNSFVPHKQQFTRTIYMTITEKTMPFVVEALQTLGFTGTQFSQLDPTHIKHISLVGQQVDLWCKHETGQDGVLREKWQISKGDAAREIGVLSNKELRELDNMFGKALKTGKPAAEPVRELAVGDAADPGITDDDIPF